MVCSYYLMIFTSIFTFHLNRTACRLSRPWMFYIVFAFDEILLLLQIYDVILYYGTIMEHWSYVRSGREVTEGWNTRACIRRVNL